MSPWPRLGLVLALLLFAALALVNLTLPGLHNDEAQEAGLQARQIVAGQPVTAFRDATIAIGGIDWPLMVQDYIGSLNILLAVPFFALLGPDVFALRLMAVSIGLATIVVTYGFASEAFGPRPAIIAAVLLAVQPSFLFWSRQGVFVTSITAALAMGALWAGAAWARRGGEWRLALAGLCVGLGIYAKLLFLWIVAGVMGAGIVLLLFTPHVSRLTPRVLATFLLPLTLGLAPLVVYNVKTGGTLTSVGGNLTTSYYGVNNLDLLRNLAARWDELRAVLAGRDHLWYLGGSFANPATEWALGLAAAVILLRALAGRPSSRTPLFVLLLALFALLQSIFTVSGLFPTHFALLMPFFPLIIALGMDGMVIEIPNSPLVILVIAGLAARDIWVDANYHRALARTGGLNAHSDAIYPLADYLDDRPDPGPVVALDWGIAPPVRFLTAGRVTPEEIFGYTREPDVAFADRLNAALDNPNTLFLIHWPQESIFPRREAFGAALAARGLKAMTVQTFSRRDGAPIFDVVKVMPAAAIAPR